MNRRRHRKDLLKLRNILMVLAGSAALGQCIANTSQENLLSTLFCLLAFIPACVLLIHPRNSQGGSSFTAAAVFLSIASNSLIPLLGTLLEGHSVVHTLQNPVMCFFHRVIFAAVLLAAHFAADSAVGRSVKDTMGHWFDLAGVRTVLNPRQVWIVGGGGLVLLLIFRSGIFGEGAIAKILQGTAFMASIPYILLIPPYLALTKKKNLWILCLFLLYATIGILGITSRMSMVGPVALIMTAYLTALLAGQARLPRPNPLTVVLVAAGGTFVAGQLMDLSAAIIMERAHRDERSLLQNLSATFNRFLDKKSLHEYKEDREMEVVQIETRYGGIWKEDYIENHFISRFTSIKFDDNLLAAAATYSDADVRTVRDVTTQKLLAQFPDPIIRMLGIPVNKEFVNGFSMGDLMDILSNRNGSLGGFRVGSMVVHSYVVFGWAYPLWLTFFLLVQFLIYQCVAIPAGRLAGSRGVSSFALVYGFALYLSFAVEGYHQLISQILRGIWQVLLLYALAVWVARSWAPAKRALTKAGKRRPTDKKRADGLLKSDTLPNFKGAPDSRAFPKYDRLPRNH